MNFLHYYYTVKLINTTIRYAVFGFPSFIFHFLPMTYTVRMFCCRGAPKNKKVKKMFNSFEPNKTRRHNEEEGGDEALFSSQQSIAKNLFTALYTASRI